MENNPEKSRKQIINAKSSRSGRLRTNQIKEKDKKRAERYGFGEWLIARENNSWMTPEEDGEGRSD